MKIWEVETFEDFKNFLHELSEISTAGFLYYQPIADKFDELYSRLRWIYRFILIAGFILGTAFGYFLKMLVGGF